MLGGLSFPLKVKDGREKEEDVQKCHGVEKGGNLGKR